MHWLTDLTDRLFSGIGITRDELLWGVLLVGLVFAGVHLMTMLVTRWGDHKATTKSLIFSLLVHISCALGLLAINPPLPAETVVKPKQKPIQLKKLLVEGEEDLASRKKGNTPIFDRLLPTPQTQLTRLEHVAPDLTPLTAPKRRPEPITRPDLELPELPIRPRETVARPEPKRSGAIGPRRQAAVPVRIDDPAIQEQPIVRVPSTSRTRQRVHRVGRTSADLARRPSRGGVDRIRPQPDPLRKLASIDAPVDPRGFLKRSRPQETVRRRTGPLPALIPDDASGTTAAETTRGAAGGSPAPPSISRLKTGSRPSVVGGAIERYRPRTLPRTPHPRSPEPIAVRRSIASISPRNGPRPTAIRPNFDTPRRGRKISLPATYRLRSLARRKEIARQFGGTDASERAVELSLRWLATHQTAEGYWDASRHGGGGRVILDAQGRDRRGAKLTDGIPGVRADSGLTALAILAFLGAGYTHEEGPYADRIDRALRWLIRQQRADGFLGGNSSHYAQMYCHAMATYAIAEAYGMQNDPTIDTHLREPLVKAVNYSLANRTQDGGWRYDKGQEQGDMSVFGWQLMALKSAGIAGVVVPKSVGDQMIAFLKSRSLGPKKGLAAYRPTESVSASMTAEALFCKQMFKIRRTNSASIEAVDYLLERLPKRSETNQYYWYYGTLAMYQYGGKPWRKWNEALRDLLVTDQITTGDAAGSWDAKGPWGPYGGRLYSTTLNTLCLEVYYRFLPLYQMGGRYDER